jgi:hypothetical protein
MSAPAVTETTQALYAELPEHFRSQDEAGGWPLLRYLAVTGDQADEVVAQLRLLQAGQMADPINAPAAWLDFLAQFVALDATGLTVPEKRVAIDSAQSLLAGSLTSMERAVESLLGGEKRYLIELHSGGDPWAITIYAHADDVGGSTWDSLAIDFPSWNAWEASGSWDNLATVAPFNESGVFETVKPAWIVLSIETITDGAYWLFLELSVTTWDQWETQFASWTDLETGVFAWP